MADGFGRNFLLLQGPHGPFFRQLGQLLEQTGAAAWRVGFNGGDAFFWDNKARFIAHTESLETWPAALRKIIAEKSITDIVLYGDTRPVHAEAIKLARALDLRVHVFEEGYLRPYWVNYERGGARQSCKIGSSPAAFQSITHAHQRPCHCHRAAEYWCRGKWKMTPQFASERVIFAQIWLCCAARANKTLMPF